MKASMKRHSKKSFKFGALQLFSALSRGAEFRADAPAEIEAFDPKVGESITASHINPFLLHGNFTK